MDIKEKLKQFGVDINNPKVSSHLIDGSSFDEDTIPDYKPLKDEKEQIRDELHPEPPQQERLDMINSIDKMMSQTNLLLKLRREQNPMINFILNGGNMSITDSITLPEETIQQYIQANAFIEEYNRIMLVYSITVDPLFQLYHGLKSLGLEE